jgi:GT2 family glycosyltransferase
MGVDILELDLTLPFTAARARNTGFRYLLQQHPDLEFVQFVDGDCEIAQSWLEKALSAFSARYDVAVVCGRRRERYPEHSLFNLLCDIEWDTPIGESMSCGGDAMMRVVALQQVGCFNSALIAGEEPELCYRLRQDGWKVLRLDAEMTLHDAEMRHFGQWWNRSIRAGYAFAEGAALHGADAERYCVKQNRSTWFWGALLPCLTLGMAVLTSGLSLLLLAGYPIMVYRIYQSMRKHGHPPAHARLYAVFCMLGKIPNFIGQIRFSQNHLLRRPSQLIEYK